MCCSGKGSHVQAQAQFCMFCVGLLIIVSFLCLLQATTLYAASWLQHLVCKALEIICGAMDAVPCLECAFVENVLEEEAVAKHLSDPESWRMLDPEIGQTFEACDGPPGWKVNLHTSEMYVDDISSVVRGADSPGTWMMHSWFHMLEHTGHANTAVDLSHCRLVVREVPKPLIINCALTILQREGCRDCFKAVFTTLSGSFVMQLQDVLLSALRMCDLLEYMDESVAIIRRLMQSKNQKLCVLVNGSTEQLACDTLFWDRFHAAGLLQR